MAAFDLFRISHSSREVGISRRKIQDMVKRGKLRSYRCEGMTFIDKTELTQLIKGGKEQAA